MKPLQVGISIIMRMRERMPDARLRGEMNDVVEIAMLLEQIGVSALDRQDRA